MSAQRNFAINEAAKLIDVLAQAFGARISPKERYKLTDLGDGLKLLGSNRVMSSADATSAARAHIEHYISRAPHRQLSTPLRIGGLWGEISGSAENHTVEEWLQRALRELDAEYRDAVNMEFHDALSSENGALPSVPEPKVGPYQFDIVDDVLVVVDQPAHLSPNADSAREYLLEQGERLLERVRGSNHPHLLAELEHLQRRISDSKNVIALGMQNASFAALVSASSEELSGGLGALLLAQSAAVNQYVAQFESWGEFSETAASVEFPIVATKSLLDMADQIASALKKDAVDVDPAVPAALEAAAGMVKAEVGGARGKLSLSRTIENLTIAALQRLRDELIVGVGNDLLGTGRKLAVVVILQGIVTWAGVMAGMPGAEWLLPVALFLRHHLNETK